MDTASTKPITVVHDADPVGLALIELLAARDIPLRQVRSAKVTDELFEAVLGSRAIIGVGDELVGSRPVLDAASLPGVGALVLITEGTPDLSDLRRSGVPYTVLRRAPLLEHLVEALGPALRSGRLLLVRGEDPLLTSVAAADVARCAAAAVDDEMSCGRVIDVVAPHASTLSDLGRRLAAAAGCRLKVRFAPRWGLRGLGLFGQRPFELRADLTRSATLEPPSWLHPEPWLGPENITAAQKPRGQVVAA